MRRVLISALALAACGSPCERLDAAQDDPAMQTCAFRGPVEDAGPLVAEDGTPLPAALAAAPAPTAQPQRLPDGTELVASYFGVSWSGAGGDLGPSDSLSAVHDAAVGAGVYALGMQTGGRVLVRSADGETLHVVRVAGGADRSLGVPRPNAAVRLAVAGSTLAVADLLGTVSAVDLERGAERWRADVGARGLALSPDGSRLAAATAETVRVWDARTGTPVAEWGGMERIRALAFSPAGGHLAAYTHGTAPTTSTHVTTRDFDNRPSNVARSETRTSGGAKPAVVVWRLPG